MSPKISGNNKQILIFALIVVSLGKLLSILAGLDNNPQHVHTPTEIPVVKTIQDNNGKIVFHYPPGAG
jgi:hypothetical protein